MKPTNGSGNTDKRLVGGTLVPGGTAIFDITYPVTESDVGGTFTIIDCVYIGTSAPLKYQVSFVPNNVDYILEFTLQIPAGASFGSEYCNYAKTTGIPTHSQASNRKAGPACFVIGGNLSLHKVNEAGANLSGAVFDVSCTAPTTTATLPDLDIAGHTFFPLVSGSTHSVTGVSTDSSGRILVQGPAGTVCTFTETQAPPGYLLPANPVVIGTATSDSTSAVVTVTDPAARPAIHVAKDDNVSHNLPVGGGLVIYTYTVTNTGNVALSVSKTADLGVSDDSCSSVTYVSGDTNSNGKLDLSEAWTFTCTTTLTNTTTNTATATGTYGDTTVTATAQDTVTVAQPVPTYCIDITKNDGQGNPLDGAVFTVSQGGQTVGTTSSTGSGDNSTGHTSLCGLLAGDYTVTETTTPDGYQTADPQSVTLPVDNQTGDASLTFVDQPVPPNTYCIDITKRDSGSEHILPGAGFTVYVADSSRVAAGPTITNSDGMASFCGLSAGDYTVSETTAPTGYSGGPSQDVSLPADTQTGNVSLTFWDDALSCQALGNCPPPPSCVELQNCPNPPPPPPAPSMSIVKTNNTTGQVVPGTAVGFTLTLGVVNTSAIAGVTIVDQLPAGIGNAAGISDGGVYNAATNRITWASLTVTNGKQLTYLATVDKAANAGTYMNTATITQGPCALSCSSSSTVSVKEAGGGGGGVLGATGTPRVTLPPTNTLDGQNGSSPSINLGLILLFLAGLTTVLGFLAPAPSRSRRRDRRG